MKLKIESTNIFTQFNGVNCRLWAGVTDTGIPCKVFIVGIAVANERDQQEFDRNNMKEIPAPSECNTISLRHIL